VGNSSKLENCRSKKLRRFWGKKSENQKVIRRTAWEKHWVREHLYIHNLKTHLKQSARSLKKNYIKIKEEV
jgi:hypothetical protein